MIVYYFIFFKIVKLSSIAFFIKIKNQKKVIISIIFSLSCDPQIINAEPLLLENPLRYIGKSTFYYIDEENSKNFNDIINLPNSAFRNVTAKADSRLFTQDAVWYKFKVNNIKSKSIERYIIFDIPWLDDIQVFIQNHTHLQKYRIGNNLSFDQRSLKTHFLNIRSNFKPGISSVYIRVKTNDPFVVPISILDERNVQNKLHSKELFHSIFYTVIFIMIILNLILYFVIFERTYLYYTFFLFSFGLMVTSYNNLTYQFLWNDSPIFQDWVQSTAIYLYSISGLVFVQSFLSLEKSFPRIYIFHKIVLMFFLSIAIVSILLGYHYHVMGAIILTIIFSIYIFTVTLYSLLNGNSYAKFFLLGTTTGLIGTSITALSAMSFFEYHEIMYNAIDYGMMIDTILISVSVAKKYKLVSEKVENLNDELIILNTKLEDKVISRTEQLEQEIINKNLLFKEMFHRVKNNMQIISSLFILQEKKIEDVNAKYVINENIVRIKIMSILYEKLYKDDNIDKKALSQYLDDVIPTILQTISDKPITYKIRCIPLILKTDDLISFGLIFNELITNSIKYGFSSVDKGEISIIVQEDKELVEIIFKDNGKGIKRDTQMGFGSKLIHSLVKYQMNGTFEYVYKKEFECHMKFPKSYLLT